MMKLRLILLISLGLFIATTALAQDIHFSNYSYSPLLLSPAKTGALLGTYRVGATARTQFSSFIENPYQTVMAYADMPIDVGFKEHHWVGAGINVFSDRAGDLAFQNSGAQLSLAYHYTLDPKYKTVITLGAQFGMILRGIDTESYRSETTINAKSDPDFNALENFNPVTPDFNMGIGIKKWTSKKAYLDFGLAVNHLLQSEYEITGIVQNPVSRRYNVFASYHIQSSKQLAIKPLLMYSRTLQFQNLFGQFNVEYKLSKKSKTILKGGLGYRLGDAIQFLAGMDYKGWDVGLAFDLTVSSAAAYTNGYGGLEIGIKKIIVTNVVPKPPPPIILCPRF